MVTAVVQLYHTQPPKHLQWIKKDTGVLCFVRDNVRKTYFFRIFCLKRNCMIWEQETYTLIDYDCRCQFLHSFEGDVNAYEISLLLYYTFSVFRNVYMLLILPQHLRQMKRNK